MIELREGEKAEDVCSSTILILSESEGPAFVGGATTRRIAYLHPPFCKDLVEGAIREQISRG